MSNNDEVVLELRRIAKLLAFIATKEQPQKDQIRLLSELAFQPKEIAELLGVAPNTVSATLYRMRNQAAKVAQRKAKKKKAGA